MIYHIVCTYCGTERDWIRTDDDNPCCRKCKDSNNLRVSKKDLADTNQFGYPTTQIDLNEEEQDVMQTQFQMQLTSGQIVDTTVESEVTLHCDCGGGLHPHIEYHEVLECVDAYTGLDIQMTDEIREELETYADDVVYTVVEREEEDVA